MSAPRITIDAVDAADLMVWLTWARPVVAGRYELAGRDAQKFADMISETLAVSLTLDELGSIMAAVERRHRPPDDS